MKGNDTIKIQGYRWFGFNRELKHVRAKKGSGGVGFFVSEELFNEFTISVHDKSFSSIIAIDLKHIENDFKLSIIGAYLPPDNSNYGRDSTAFFAQLISLVYSTMNSDLTILCGDFNARTSDQLDYIPNVDDLLQRKCLDKTKNNHGESLIDFLKDTKMCILNGRITPDLDNFTCISSKGKSVVDYFITPYDCIKYCKKLSVRTVSDLIDHLSIQDQISSRCKPPDHSVVTLELTYSLSTADRLTQHQGHEQNENTSHKRKMYCFDKKPDMFMKSESWRLAILDIVNSQLNHIKSQQEVDHFYSHFCTLLTKELDEYLLVNNVKKKSMKKCRVNKPYWNDDLTKLWKIMCEKEKLFVIFNGKKSEKSFLHNEYKTAMRSFDKKLRQCERLYNFNKGLELESCSTKDPNEFWNYISKLGPKKDNSIPMKIREGDTFIINEKEVLDRWKDDFGSLYNAPGNLDFDDTFQNEILQQKDEIELNLSETNDFVNEPISYNEVRNAVKKLKNKKAVGVDFLPNEVLKCDDVILAMCYMFKLFFQHSMIPSLWLRSIVNPIPKGGKKDPYLPLNYRGISLLSCVYKVYTSILNHRIINYCEMLDIFVDEQNGFRRGRSCEDHIFSLTSVINNRLDEHKDTFAAFIDLEKAFDWIDRDMLFYRLLQYNIDGKMYKAVKSLYNDCYTCIRINNHYTDWFPVTTGVKQGDNISPTLFSLYINELAKEINNLNLGVKLDTVKISILLYADDMVLIAENEEDLQKMLSTMQEWCKKWRLKVNSSKSNIVHFRPRRTPKSNFAFMYNDCRLETVTNYKYLGVIFDEHLNFSMCSKTLADSGGRALSAIISKLKLSKNVGFKTFTKLYESCVVPVTDYGSGVWGKFNCSHSDTIQNRAVRHFLGVHKFTPIPALHAEMGWLIPKYRKYLNMLRLWNRIQKMPNERITKRIFFMDYNRVDGNWSEQMREIFDLLDMSHVFNERKLCDLLLCTEKLYDIFKDNCMRSVETKPKLRTFKLFKKDCETSVYVKGCMNKCQRSLLAKFRCGILQLKVETGRFERIELEKRICMLCERKEIETEFHFLINCDLYKDQRNMLYTKANDKYKHFHDMDDQAKFIYLMTECQYYVAKYIESAWNIRKEKLYS